MVTINQQPQLYTPVYNPMRFVLSSTNSSQPNFKYMVDVYVSGVAGHVPLLYQGDPTTGNAAADISRVLESYITHDVSHTTFGFLQCGNSLKAYEVKFGEQYGPTSGIVNYPMQAVTGTKYAWNGVFNPLDFITFDYTRYLVGSLAHDFLTNHPAVTRYSGYEENDALYFLNPTSGVAYFGIFESFDSAGNSLSKFSLLNPFQASSAIADKLLRVTVGPGDIGGLTGVTQISGNPAFINIGEAYYTFHLENFAGTTTSITYRFEKECVSKYGDPIILRFLSPLGGFDKFNLQLVRRSTSDIKRDMYQKNLGTLTGTTWGYADMDGGETVMNTEITDRQAAQSDWINSAEATWLRDLFESPVVFQHLGAASGSMIPVTVIQNSYETKNTQVEKLFNISIEVKYSNKRWTQRG